MLMTKYYSGIISNMIQDFRAFQFIEGGSFSQLDSAKKPFLVYILSI